MNSEVPRSFLLHNLLVKTVSEIIAYKSICLYGQKNDLVTYNEFLTTNKKMGTSYCE